MFFQCLEETEEKFNLTFSSVAAGLIWSKDQEKKQAIATALDFLCSKRIAVLERRFELRASGSSNKPLAEPICEPIDSVIRRALDDKVLINPKTRVYC